MRPSIAELRQLPESESLDFKREFHESAVELLHDILCLANAYAESDRYLVFGIADDHSVFGVEADAHAKTNANIQDLLRGASLNRIPDVRLEEQTCEGHKVAVMTIKNRPDKPFFVLRDKQHGKSTLRNGVIYTRIGDTNVPLTETAPDDRIELMWRERFGIGLPPLERFRRLLPETHKWRSGDHGGKTVLHHADAPEFTIMDGDDLVEDFAEEWMKHFPDKRANSFHVELRYHATVLAKLLFVNCDGGRYRLPAPKTPSAPYTIERVSFEYLVANLYKQYQPLDEVLTGCRIQIV